VKRRKQKRSKTFAISFILVISVLVGGSLVLIYFVTQPTVNHLPSTLPTYSAGWASYAPSSALQFTFRNYTALRALNSTALANGTFIATQTPVASLPFSAVRTFVTVVFSTPNATVDIAFVDPSEFSVFYGIFQSRGPAPIIEGDARLYVTQVAGSQSGTGGYTAGWLVAIPSSNAIGFSEGTGAARTAIESVLAVRNGSVPTILTRTDVTQMFYIAGGADTHIAFTVQNFPGLVSSGQMTLQVVDDYLSTARTSYIVKFNSTNIALAQYDFVKNEYPTSQYFAIYDQYVLSQKTQSLSELSIAVQSVG